MPPTPTAIQIHAGSQLPVRAGAKLDRPRPGGRVMRPPGRAHRRASTTNRYVHFDDATLSQAAERVAAAIARKLRHAGGAER